MSAPASVVWVLPDKLGGVAVNVADVLAHRSGNGMPQHVVLTDNRLSDDIRYQERMPADGEHRVQYALPTENLFSVLRRLAGAVPPGPGVLVANDWLELAMLSIHDPGRTVIFILHGDYEYYYDLAVMHEPLISAFVALTRIGYEQLIRRLPHRREAIFHQPFGVPRAARLRSAASGSPRLLFVGRLERAKGAHLLSGIDEALHHAGIVARWTVVGDGAGLAESQAGWIEPARVRWLGVQTNAQVLSLYADHDLLVLPSSAEGLPRVVLEAMSAGVVPVASDLPCGIRDIVEHGRTGFLPRPGDVAAFAAAIGLAVSDRRRFEEMSGAAQEAVDERFDARRRAGDFEALLAQWPRLSRPRPERVVLRYGSRLDQPWLPNALVKTLRAVRGIRQPAQAR